jgi:hypothetical protein
MNPWFSRRWIIQEIACVRQLSVRVSHHVMSWLDFTDAVDIFLRNTDRIRGVVEQARLFAQNELILPSAAECSRVMALMELSRNCFRKTAELTIKTRLMSLEALVLAASPFEVSEVRDTIYALLYMANDRESMLRHRNPWEAQFLLSDYSRHPLHIFVDFFNYCLQFSQSLDIIHRRWVAGSE